MAAIIGAAPTVLIAYLLEFRYYRSLIGARNYSKVVERVGYFGAATTVTAGATAAIALAEDKVAFWYYWALFAFTFGFGSMFGLGTYTTFLHRGADTE